MPSLKTELPRKERHYTLLFPVLFGVYIFNFVEVKIKKRNFLDKKQLMVQAHSNLYKNILSYLLLKQTDILVS